MSEGGVTKEIKNGEEKRSQVEKKEKKDEKSIYSAPTLISRPKSVKSRLNPDQNFKKNRPNPDHIGPFSQTGFTKTGLIRTWGKFYNFKATFP